jgi:type III pantothenate kinase
MQAGLFFGYVAMVEGIVQRLRSELAGDGHAFCIATGGLADAIAPETAAIDTISPDLTLQGLRLVWDRNRERLNSGKRDAFDRS